MAFSVSRTPSGRTIAAPTRYTRKPERRIYNRANWCPGLEVKPYGHWLTPYITANDSLAVDVDMDPYLNQGITSAAITSAGIWYCMKHRHLPAMQP